uniref:Cystatin domain-containing protein n=1 Tax=Periophthalmus magnuspinnatus TaxID=409849 RepID=A0A3B3Z782_9GOBI
MHRLDSYFFYLTFYSSTSTSVIGVHAACGWRCIPGGPCDVSIDDSSVQQAALSAAVQKQVVKGIRFLVDLNLCRTMCRKRDKAKNLSDCGLQPPGPLHQVFRCHVEVWDVPWSHHSIIQRLSCKTLSSAAQRSESQPVRDSD